MSASPRGGVVDPNGQVHSVPGLYVTGTSVFTTGGHANPTFTAIALGLRLADHLRTTLGCARRSAEHDARLTTMLG